MAFLPVVRRAFPAEAGPVADVFLRSREASPDIPPSIHGPDQVRAWFAEVVLPNREVWVAEGAGGDILALLVLEEDYVDQLYVLPGWTQRGIGTWLLDLAKALRPDGLGLWTFAANIGARRFYERHGFLAVDETDGDNEEGAPDVRYEWRPV